MQVASGNNECRIVVMADTRIGVRDSRYRQERERSMADEIMNRNTAAALFAGALVGAGFALLFAPQSGRKTRRDIRQFADRVGNKAEAARLELQRSIDNIVDDVEEKLREGLAGGMDWTDSKIADLQRALDAARKSIAKEIAKIQST
jgi:gas vesicle protein